MGTTRFQVIYQLAKEHHWSLFPDPIQERLYRHYLTYTHEGNLRLAARDIQSASDTLSWLLQGARLDAFLKEHREWFGEASTDDLAAMAKQLAALQHTRSTILVTLLKPRHNREPGGTHGATARSATRSQAIYAVHVASGK